MSEVLSQNEIDSLLAALSTGELDVDQMQAGDEVIVTDSYSKDNTVELARAAGAKVYQHEYIGDGLQKNLALPYASNNWVISLDADERLSDELVEVISQTDFERSIREIASMGQSSVNAG